MEAADASRENGKLGGRPKSEATIRSQLAREYISLQLKDSLPAIVAKAITQAIEGNSEARNWLSDRGWGKAPINLGVDEDGEKIVGVPILGGATLEKAAE
jgi:hypothetical protein